MANTMQIDFTKLLNVKGVDGYIVLDLECDILESQIPEGIVLNQIENTIADTIRAHHALSGLETTLLLTEKGVVQISLMKNFYLVIIAGYHSSVDVTKLTTITEELKASLTNL